MTPNAGAVKRVKRRNASHYARDERYEIRETRTGPRTCGAAPYAANMWTPGLFFLEGLAMPVPFDDELPYEHRRGISGRFQAAEDLPPGLVVALGADSRWRVADPSSLGLVLGVVLAVRGVDVWPEHSQPPILRRGLVTVAREGASPAHLDVVHVRAGGRVARDGGVLLPNACWFDGALDVSF